MPSHRSIKEIVLRILSRAPAVTPSLEEELARERDAFLQDLRPLPVPSSEESNQLHAMPSELLRNIARYLPASSEVCLTLTCRLVLCKLGRRSWEEINISMSQERCITLRLLDRDLDHLIACHFCQILHEPGKTLPVGRNSNSTKRTERKCTNVERNRKHGRRQYYFHLLDDITFSEIQYSMKLHLRFGGDCTSLLQRLSNTSPTFTFDVKFWDSWLQLSTLARVISGQLVIRSEYYIIVPWYKVRVTDQAIIQIMKTLKICPHKLEGTYSWIFQHQWRCRVRNRQHCYHCRVRENAPNEGIPQFVAAPAHWRCELCPTEFQITVTPRGEEGLAIAFTVWQSLGDCASPYGTIWDGVGSDICEGQSQPADFEGPSIKDGFEADSSSNAPVTMRVLPQLPVKAKGLRSLQKPKKLLWESVA
ncbi:hypothetical protein N431DRAFT_561189 [Stipitochalara longipes BDJ]|nr:hypothetical protein N431DRAFT_561189 [Stipitochalara longipes BDJ]